MEGQPAAALVRHHVRLPLTVRVKTEPGKGSSVQFRRRSLNPRSAASRGSEASKTMHTRVKREAKVKKEVKIKQEQLSKVKSKPWDPIQHFTHQVAVVQQFIPAPRKWNRFLGNLGTGILGARPADSPDADKGFVFLFLNAGAARLQEWNGRMMSGFAPSLDRQRRVLRWESQRNDKTGRVISQISEHVQAGVEVVVAVRSSPGELFHILGCTRNFCQDTEARFLPQPGDHLIGERGSARMHKYITAQCIDAALKAGIGLVPYQYPLPQRSWKPQFCTACCWKPATAILTFSSLGEKAAEILDPTSKALEPEKPTLGKQAVKRELSSVRQDPANKLPHGKRAVKREPGLPELPVAVKMEPNTGIKAVTTTGIAARVRRRWPVNMIVIPDDSKPSSHSASQPGAQPSTSTSQPNSRSASQATKPDETGSIPGPLPGMECQLEEPAHCSADSRSTSVSGVLVPCASSAIELGHVSSQGTVVAAGGRKTMALEDGIRLACAAQQQVTSQGSSATEDGGSVSRAGASQTVAPDSSEPALCMDASEAGSGGTCPAFASDTKGPCSVAQHPPAAGVTKHLAVVVKRSASAETAVIRKCPAPLRLSTEP